MDKLPLISIPHFFVYPLRDWQKYNPMVKTEGERNIRFIGDHKNDSLLIGNYGNAKITAIGNFRLSGLIFCPKSTIEFEIAGEGTARFNGICRKLLIQRVEGNCELDLTNVACQTVRCNEIKGKAVILLGNNIRSIEIISVEDGATIRYEGMPLIINHALSSSAGIEFQRMLA
jgi:hypothetical protein